MRTLFDIVHPPNQNDRFSYVHNFGLIFSSLLRRSWDLLSHPARGLRADLGRMATCGRQQYSQPEWARTVYAATTIATVFNAVLVVRPLIIGIAPSRRCCFYCYQWSVPQ
jgi:hypothetical protein